MNNGTKFSKGQRVEYTNLRGETVVGTFVRYEVREMHGNFNRETNQMEETYGCDALVKTGRAHWEVCSATLRLV